MSSSVTISASHLSKHLLIGFSRCAVVCRARQASSLTSGGASTTISTVTCPSITITKHIYQRPRQPLASLTADTHQTTLERNCYRFFSNRATVFNLTKTMPEIQQPERTNRVLSIQSHVVHGYVGNKSATFPLQVLGFEVDPINSVHFSNHTGYDFIKGQVLSDIDLGEVFSGLEQNQLLNSYTHLLTGYIGKDSFLHQVRDIVKAMRKVNPNLVYVCDPVLGDNGHMYVPEGLLPIYQEEIVPLADICTPNQFEVELLTGHKLESIDDTWKSLLWFHERGVQTVVLSSTNMGPDGTLLTFLSHKIGTKRLKYTVSIPKKGDGINFTGTGDLFASLFLAHSTLAGDLGEALQNTIATVQSVIERTLDLMPEEIRSSPSKVTSRQRELKIIQSKADIEHPKVTLLAVQDQPDHINNGKL